MGTIVWLLKTLLLKVVASFQVSTFFDRIQECLFNQHVIETLSGPPLIEIQQEREEEDRVIEVLKLQSAGATLPANLSVKVDHFYFMGLVRLTCQHLFCIDMI